MKKALLFFLPVWAFIAVAAGQPLPALIPYVDGNKWGYCDSNGRVAIQPKWRNVGFFKNGRASVYTENSNGVINTQGAYIIPPYRHWDGKYYTSVIGAYYNARSKDGKYGIIDSNNRELLPCIYDKSEWGNGFLNSGYFFWDKRHNKYVGKVRKNGKYGLVDTLNNILIPFEYDGIDVDTCCTFGSSRFYSVIITKGTEWKHGVIAAGNRVIIPPNKYRNAWLDEHDDNQIMLFKERTTVIADTNGKIIWEVPGYRLGWPRYSHVPVGDSTGKHGLMNNKHELVIPCIYMGVWLQHDTIVLSQWSDTTANKFQQFKYCDIRTYKEISGWLTYEQHMKLPPPAEKVQEQPHKNFPNARRMHVKGKDVYQYKIGNILWAAIDYAKWPECLMPVQGIGDDDTTASYAAVIDSNGNYVIAPQKTKNEIRVINATDSLLVIKKPRSDSSLVADFRLKTLLTLQQYDIKAAFYYDNTLYAVTDQQYAHYEQSYGSGRGYVVYDHNYYLITADGKPAKGMEHYKLHWFTDSTGRRMGIKKYGNDRDDGFNAAFGGCFMVSDSAGKRGIVSIDGRVLLQGVSFKYNKLYPSGGDVFLVDNTTGQSNNYYPERWTADNANAIKMKNKLQRGFPYLVNRHNEVLLDSMTVETVTNMDETGATPLYSVYLKRRADQPYDNIHFYMNNKGKGYYTNLLSEGTPTKK